MDDDSIVVSVYCLAYNHEKYIRDALEGFILQETDFQYEVLVHDDASTDETAKIIEEYARKYPEIIKPIYQTINQYSRGIRIVDTFIYPNIRGRYIAICEGDDYWCDKYKLQRQVDFLESNKEYSACVHNTKQIDCRTEEETLFNPSVTDMIVPINDILQWGNARFHTSSIMLRKEYYMLPKEFRAKGFSDYPLAIYLAMVGKVHYMKEVMSVYRFYAEGSWTNRMNLSEEHVQRQIEHYQEVNRMLGEIDKYSKKKYHKEITTIIRKNEFGILCRQENYQRVLKEYKDLVRVMSLKARIKIWLQAYVPAIWKLYEFLKKRKKQNEC